MQRNLFRPLLTICLLGAFATVDAAESDRHDRRAVTVESTLKDLSRTNDAAIGGRQLTPMPGKDALGQPRTDLVREPPPDTAAVVSGEVQSSLHRLRRETVIRQAPDDRAALVQDALDRQAEDAGGATAPRLGPATRESAAHPP